MAAFRHPLLALVLSFAFLATGPAAEIARVLCGEACSAPAEEAATEAIGCCPAEGPPCAATEETDPEGACHEEGLCGCVCERGQHGVLPVLTASPMAPVIAKSDAGAVPCQTLLHVLRQAPPPSREYSLTAPRKVLCGRVNVVLCTFLC